MKLQTPWPVTVLTPETWENKGRPRRRVNVNRDLTRSSGTSREGLAMKATQCSVDGCDRGGRFKRGMCGMHYQRLQKRGTTDPSPDRLTPTEHVAVEDQCSIEGCERCARKRGMCDTCYARLRRRGEIERILPVLSLTERLAAGLERKPNGCLEWTGYTGPRGYGQIQRGARGGGAILTHRLAWELANGPIPDGLAVCHKCDNPPCCDVAHLFLGTWADNNADMRAKGRASGGGAAKTHCVRGHPFDEANTYMWHGRRHCRTCQKVRQQSTTTKETS